ncbi:MAG: hypothetical protein ACJ8GW_05315, partial [Massilia sp.]
MFGSPFLLLSAHQQSGPGATVILAVLTLLLFAGVYFYFSLFGHRSGRSPRLRYLGAGMIAFQLMAGSWLLTTSHNAKALVASAPLLCFTVFLFLA